MGLPFIFEVLGLLSCNSDVVYTNFILVWLLNKQFIAYVNHIQIRVWTQPVPSNEGKVSGTRKQQEPLTGFELMTDW